MRKALWVVGCVVLIGMGLAPAASAQSDDSVGDVCLDTLFGGSANCVSSDVELRNLVLNSVTGSCLLDESFTASFTAEIFGNSDDRYDIGAFVGLGDQDAKIGNLCLHDFFDDTDSDFVDLDGGDVDICGDIVGSTTITKTLADRQDGDNEIFEVSCVDRNLTGLADVSFCVSWGNNQNNQGGELCDSLGDANPSTPAKCFCGERDTSLPLPGKIIIEKTTVPAGGEGFEFSHDIDESGNFFLDHDGSMEFDITEGWEVPEEGADDPTNWSPQIFSVTELAPPDPFVLDNIVCTENLTGRTGADNTTVNVGERLATILLDPGETVTCEFVNVDPRVPAAPPLALVALLLILGTGGFWYLRRRTAS